MEMTDEVFTVIVEMLKEYKRASEKVFGLLSFEGK